MDEQALIDGYAEGIFAVARSEGVLDRVEDELYQVARMLDSNAELGQRLSDPALEPSAKLGLVDGLLSGRAHPQTVSALLYVIAAGRGRQLAEIADAVVARAAAERNRQIAEVRTAIALDDDHKERLATALSQATGQQITVKVTVDPDVVGGVVVKVGDTVIDGSIARRLTELRSVMTG